MKYSILIGLTSLGILSTSWAQSSTDNENLDRKIQHSVEIQKDLIQQRGGVVNGGGGGFICPPNEPCKTLAEAGLKIKVSSTDSGQIKSVFTIPLEVVNEVKAIFSQVAFPKHIKKTLLEKVVGEYGTYLLVEEADADKFSKIKAQYEKVVQSQSSSIEMKYFELAAWSDTCVSQEYQEQGKENAKTYLLPAFEKLSLTKKPLRYKALNLIHEANYRARCDDKLDMVLAFDAKLEELLANPKLIYDKNYDLIELGIIFKNLNWDYDYKTFVFLIEMLKRKNQSLVRLDTFCNSIDEHNSTCHVSYEKLVQLASFDKRIPNLIHGTRITLRNSLYQNSGLVQLPPDSPYLNTLAAACNQNFDLKSPYSELNSLLMTTEGLQLNKASVSAEALGLEDLNLVAVLCVPQPKTSSWDVWYSVTKLNR